jgi:hypothetical protein
MTNFAKIVFVVLVFSCLSRSEAPKNILVILTDDQVTPILRIFFSLFILGNK